MPINNISPHASLVTRGGISDFWDFALAPNFVNAGTIEAHGGSLELDISSTVPPWSHTITNTGLIEADAGGILGIEGAKAYETVFDSLNNSGTLLAKGGTIDMKANLHQTAAGKVQITQGGALVMEAAATGGTIQITDGMLGFGLYGREGGPIAAGQCTSQIQFLGHTGTLVFYGAAISEVFKAATQELIISAPGPSGGPLRQIADLHLSGRTYAASDFHVHAGQVLFAH